MFLPSTEDSHLGRGGGMTRTAESQKSAICGAFGTGDGEFVVGGTVPFGNRQIHPRFDDARDTRNVESSSRRSKMSSAPSGKASAISRSCPTA